MSPLLQYPLRSQTVWVLVKWLGGVIKMGAQLRDEKIAIFIIVVFFQEFPPANLQNHTLAPAMEELVKHGFQFFLLVMLGLPKLGKKIATAFS